MPVDGLELGDPVADLPAKYTSPKVVPLMEWSSEKTFVTKAMAIDLIRIERVMNDLIMDMYLTYHVIDNFRYAALARAKYVQALGDATADARNLLAPMRKTLADLELKRSATFYAEWVENVQDMCMIMRKLVIAEGSGALKKVVKTLDLLIPRWGSFLSDTTLDDDLVRLQLVQNCAIRRLPSTVRELATAIGDMRTLGTALNIENISEHSGARDAMRMATNSFDFGKKTVNIAAAARLLYEPRDAALASMDLVMKFRSSLPQALLRRLEAIEAEGDAPEPPPAKASGKQQRTPRKRVASGGAAAAPSKAAKQEP